MSQSKRENSRSKAAWSGRDYWLSTSVEPNFLLDLCRLSLVRALNPFPPRMRVLMVAHCTGSVTASSGQSNRYDVLGNSCYQPFNGSVPLPNISGGGSATTDPAGFMNTLSSTGPYRQFRVIGSAIRLEFLIANAGDNLELCVVPTQPGLTHHSGFTVASQAKYAVTRMAGFGQGSRSIMSNDASTAAIYGVTKGAVLSEDDFLGAYNANPSNSFGWEVWYQTCDGATNSGALGYSCTIAFDVLLENNAISQADDDVEFPKSDASSNSASAPLRSSSSASSSSTRDGYFSCSCTEKVKK
jgi:hypothetical protein